MWTREKAEIHARRQANESGNIVFIVRLNQFSSLGWVVRSWSKHLADEAAKERGDVIAICPA